MALGIIQYKLPCTLPVLPTLGFGNVCKHLGVLWLMDLNGSALLHRMNVLLPVCSSLSWWILG